MKNTRTATRLISTAEPLEARIAPAVIFAVETDTNKLIKFDSTNPGVLLQETSITGLQANEFVDGIDFDQATGRLLAFATADNGAVRSSHTYAINLATGVATFASPISFTALDDTPTYGADVDPTDGSFHLINGLDANFGTTTNGSFAGKHVDDPNQNESIAGLAYTHNFGGGGGSTTTLYGYNFLTDELVTIGDLGGAPLDVLSGVVKPVAHFTLGGNNFVSNSPSIGFDIAAAFGGAEIAYLTASSAGNGTHLYTVDLKTAAMTDLGAVGNGSRLFGGMSVSIDASAPAISGHKATWTDLDGDLITMTVSKGTLTADNFRMIAGTNGSALAKLSLDATFAGADIIVTAKPGPTGGDGLVNLGRIIVNGADLGNVTIPGTIAEIDAGTAAVPTPSLKSLTIRGFNRELLPMTESGLSSLADGAGKITINGDLTGRLDVGNGKVGSLVIAGDVVGGDYVGAGSVQGGGSVGSILVKGSLRGGTASNTGSILFAGSGPTVATIAGGLLGSGGFNSGSLKLNGTATVKIGGDLHGGIGSSSGSLSSDAVNTSFFKSVTIGGSVIAEASGEGIFANRLGAVTIKGSLIGDAGNHATIIARGGGFLQTQAAALAIAKVTIGGSVHFGGIHAGVTKALSPVNVDVAIGAISVGGDFLASSVTAGIDVVNGVVGDADDKFIGGNSGSTTVIAKIASVTIKGQLAGTLGGSPDSFGIEAEQIGLIKVGLTKLPLTTGKDNLATGFTADIHVKEF